METDKRFTYWRHLWRGTCHRALKGEEWGLSIWEQITEDEYEDWVWNRKKIWTWDREIAREELGLELL